MVFAATDIPVVLAAAIFPGFVHAKVPTPVTLVPDVASLAPAVNPEVVGQLNEELIALELPP